MPSPTKADLLAENRRFARRMAALERVKKKSARPLPRMLTNLAYRYGGGSCIDIDTVRRME